MYFYVNFHVSPLLKRPPRESSMNLQQAYSVPNQAGSCLTAPLRSYHTWFQGKIEGATDLTTKIAYVALGIFATLILGIPALIGILINLCQPVEMQPAATTEELIPKIQKLFQEMRKEEQELKQLKAEISRSG